MTKTPTSFAEFLNSCRADDEKILVALRYYVAEVTDDKLPGELRGEVVAHVGDAVRVEQAVQQLAKERSAEVAAALAFLSAQWNDPAERPRIVRGFEGSGTKLPVIESGLVAMVAMYGLFLYFTGGRKHVKRTVRRGPDDTFEDVVEEEMWGPTGPLKAVVDMLRPGAKAVE
jgi:hypothetical protein